MRRRSLRAAAAAILASAVLAACGGAPPGRQGKPHWLRIATGQGDPNSLNIHFDTSAMTGYVSELTGAFLARYDKNGNPVPDLAVVIPTKANGGISADGKTIVWHLRRGVRWSDGAPFSGDDVVFSVHAIMNPRNNEEQGTAGWDTIAKMDEPDPYTVIFHLTQPYGSYLPLFFGTAANEPNILPKHLLGTLPDINTEPYNARPVGTGPFRVVAWRRGDSIELEANPYYWKGRPKLDRITYKLLPSMETLATQMQTGDVDVWPLMSPSYTARLSTFANLEVKAEPTFRTTNVDIQMQGRPIVADIRVREAIRYAIDRREMIAKLLHGYGSLHDGVVIPLGPLTSGPVFANDPAKAQRLLDAAGWHPGADGIRTRGGERLSLLLVYPLGTLELDGTAELLRAQLHAVGIEVETKKYAPNVFRALPANGGVLYSGKWDLALFPRSLEAVSDVTGFYSCGTRPPHGLNASRYCNPGVDRLLRETEAAYDAPTRIKRFGEVQALIDDDVPTVLLYVWKGGFAWNTAVRGYDPPILTPFDDMLGVDVN